MSESETDHGSVTFGDELVGNQHVESLGGKDLMAERYEDSDYATTGFELGEMQEFPAPDYTPENRRVAAIAVAQSLPNIQNVGELLDAARQVEAYLAGTSDLVPGGPTDGPEDDPGVGDSPQG